MSEPVRMVVYHCDGGSLTTPGSEPSVRGVGFVRVPCAGRISTGDLLRPLRAGALGVVVAGCEAGACRFTEGEGHACEAVADVDALMVSLGLGQGRVAYFPTGSGKGLETSTAALLTSLSTRALPTPEPSQRRRLSAMMDRIPPWPHHGAVQELTLLSHVTHEAPVTPSWAAQAVPDAETLLYVCDLPLVEGLLGRHFPARTTDTLKACLALLSRVGLPARVSAGLPCCGHDFELAGVDQEREAEARRVCAALDDTGVRRIAVVSSECEHQLGVGFPRLGVAPQTEVIGLVSLLYEHVDALGPFVEEPAEPAVLYAGDATAEARDSAEALLRAAGVEVVATFPNEYDAGGDQGSAGVQGFVSCDGESRAAQGKLLDAVKSAGAETLITLSVLSGIHLRCASRRGSWTRSPVQVQSFYDALADRLGQTDDRR